MTLSKGNTWRDHGINNVSYYFITKIIDQVEGGFYSNVHLKFQLTSICQYYRTHLLIFLFINTGIDHFFANLGYIA